MHSRRSCASDSESSPSLQGQPPATRSHETVTTQQRSQPNEPSPTQSARTRACARTDTSTFDDARPLATCCKPEAGLSCAGHATATPCERGPCEERAGGSIYETLGPTQRQRTRTPSHRRRCRALLCPQPKYLSTATPGEGSSPQAGCRQVVLAQKLRAEVHRLAMRRLAPVFLSFCISPVGAAHNTGSVSKSEVSTALPELTCDGDFPIRRAPVLGSRRPAWVGLQRAQTDLHDGQCRTSFSAFSMSLSALSPAHTTHKGRFNHRRRVKRPRWE